MLRAAIRVLCCRLGTISPLAIALLLATAFLPRVATAENLRASSSAGMLRVETVATGLVHPWALAFLPDQRMLVSERPGRLRIVAPDGTLGKPLAGLPPIWARGQGGLLDVVVDRAFPTTRMMYFCFAEGDGNGARTSVAKAILNQDAATLEDVAIIFRQQGPLSSGNHFGCRIAQMADKTLVIGLGDHYSAMKEAQNLGNHIGKVVRIATDGKAPKDNPFAAAPGAQPEIFSYGHRNIQSLMLHPVTGAAWAIEHGPRGGDEVNILRPGRNYGWPVIGYGIDYSGARLHQATHAEGMEQPIKYWVPSIAPSGMAFVTRNTFPGWNGSLMVGALAGRMLVRLSVEGDRITGEERLLKELGERIRDVREGPDGALWLLTDSDQGRLLRVTPLSP